MMAGILRTVQKNSIILLKKDSYLFSTYEDMLAPLLRVCKSYSAALDLTDLANPVIIGSTGKCRREVRHLYGQDVQQDRIGSALYLRGLL